MIKVIILLILKQFFFPLKEICYFHSGTDNILIQETTVHKTVIVVTMCNVQTFKYTSYSFVSCSRQYFICANFSHISAVLFLIFDIDITLKIFHRKVPTLSRNSN